MYNSISNIKDTIGNYSLDYLDCFERPISIAVNFIKQGYGNLYIAYRKLFQSFSITREKEDRFFETYPDLTGIEAHTIEIHDNLTETIISLLDQNHAVLVPGDLIALYYSSHYMKDNWNHLFLIKGYDRKRSLFHMLDSIQQRTDDGIPKCIDFPIRFSDLEAIFQAFALNEKPVITYFQIPDSDTSFQERVLKCCKSFMENIVDENYIEKRMNVPIVNDPNKRVYINLLMNCPKYRFASLDSLLTCLDSLSYDSQKLRQTAENLKTEWTKNNQVFSLTLLKAKEGVLHYPVNSTLKALEQDFQKEMSSAIAYLSSHKQESDQTACYLNNEDKIIMKTGSGTVFHFHNGKTYDSWLGDDSPKVAVYSEKTPIEDFDFQISYHSFMESSVEGHEEGIYFKTSDDDLFMYGIDYLQNISLDYAGKTHIGYYDNVPLKEERTLKLERKGKQLVLSVILKDDSLFPVHTMQFEEGIYEIGFFAKTWNTYTELKFEFYDVALHTYKNGSST